MYLMFSLGSNLFGKEKSIKCEIAYKLYTQPKNNVLKKTLVI